MLLNSQIFNQYVKIKRKTAVFCQRLNLNLARLSKC